MEADAASFSGMAVGGGVVACASCHNAAPVVVAMVDGGWDVSAGGCGIIASSFFSAWASSSAVAQPDCSGIDDHNSPVVVSVL